MGGGQSDSLSIVDRRGAEHGHAEVNRFGSAHLLRRFDQREVADENWMWPGFWAEWLAAPDPRRVLRAYEAWAGLPAPHSVGRTVGHVLVYRVISAITAAVAFGRVRVEARNGYLDSSGSGGGGARHELFRAFPETKSRLEVRQPDDLLKQPAYRFWFLLRDEQPLVCFEELGRAWTNTLTLDLNHAYRRAGRRLWPVVLAVADDLLE